MEVNESPALAAFETTGAPGATPLVDAPAPPGVEASPAQTPAKPSGSIFAPLRHRNFSLLFSGQLISSLGDQVYGLALPWTVLTVTGDARQMAIVLAAETVPRIVILLLGGALADRLNPRVVMLGADIGRTIVVGVLGVTLFFGLPPLWVVSVLAGLQGVGSGLFGPGFMAMIPRLLPEEQLPAGNGLFMVIQYGTLAIGPVLGGIATAAQATLAFLADAATFAISAVTLFFMRVPRRAGGNASRHGAAESSPDATMNEATADTSEFVATPRKGIFREIGSGMRYSFAHPLIRATMAITTFGNFGFAAAGSVGIVVLSHAISPSAVTLGLLLAALGVGGIVGGLSSGLLGKLPHRGVVALVLYFTSAVCLGLIPLAAGAAGHIPYVSDLLPTFAFDTNTRIAIIAGLLGLTGFIVALGDTMFTTVMQQRVAPEYMARVFSMQALAGGITQPVSLVLAGYLAATFGPGIVFAVGAVFLAMGVLLGFGSRELRRV